VHLEDPSAESILQPGNHAGDPVVVPEPGDLDREVGSIARSPEVSVAVADQSHDTLHSGPDLVIVQMRDLTTQ
jgi:hypothetical protein